MTKAALIQDLKKMIGPGIEVDDAGLAVWLNDSYLYLVDEIQKANPDYFTKSATADSKENQTEYALPNDFERAMMVTIDLAGTTYRPQFLELGETKSYGASSEYFTLANPRYYIVGNKIGFLPTPTETADENIRLWYVYTPTELSADSDEPAFPKKFHHLLKYGAYATYLDQDDEHVAAENMRRRFDDRIEKMVESMSTNQLDQPRSVQITNGLDLYYDESGW